MNALTFITCGSVDDGKSTLIGRLLLDSKAILSDQLANASNTSHRSDDGQQPDLAAFTDGLQAEREQGITIDVAWRYFATPARKFIIGDTPGHVQYTRNMVTAATNADAAVVLVDATKLDWQNPALELLAQTRRHSLLVNRLRVPSVVFAINKLDAVDDPQTAFTNISAALHHFAALGQIDCAGTVPVSALMGYNVVLAHPGWAGYNGPSLLALLEGLPTIAELETISAAAQPPSLPHLAVQWVENRNTVPLGLQGRRIYWGRLAVGTISVGSLLQLSPSGQHAEVAQLLTTTRQDLGDLPAQAGDTVGVVLDREIDVSRGDWLIARQASLGSQHATATIAWLDEQPLNVGRTYWALHGHRWVKVKVCAIDHQIDIATLTTSPTDTLVANSIGQVQLHFQTPLPLAAYATSRGLGSLILVDTASHSTSAAVLINA